MIQINEFLLKPCETNEELSIAAQLRYQAYRNVEAIKENERAEFTDKYDAQPNTKTCLIYEDNKALASVRACVYSKVHNFMEIPSFEVYKDEIEKELGLDKVIVESNRFVITPEMVDSKSLFKIPFRFIILNLHKFKGDFIITAVREKHIPLYKRFLTMEPISGLKKYPGIDVDMVLMAGDCKKNLQAVIDKESFFSIPREEVDAYTLSMQNTNAASR